MNLGTWLLTSDSPTATRSQRWFGTSVSIVVVLAYGAWRAVSWPFRRR